MNEWLPRSYERVADILGILVEIHKRAAGFGERIPRRREAETREELLVRQVAARQRNLAKFIDQSLGGATDAVLQTWVQYIPSESVQVDLEKVEQGSAGTLAERTVGLQGRIAKFIATLRDEATEAEVREFFELLAVREEAEARESAKLLTSMDDA